MNPQPTNNQTNGMHKKVVIDSKNLYKKKQWGAQTIKKTILMPLEYNTTQQH